MRRYIHELPEWPNFSYDPAKLLARLSEISNAQGMLIGRLEGLQIGDRQDAKLEAISDEIIKSSDIEGERLDLELVRSSIANRLGIEYGGLPKANDRIEGVVDMTLDATENWAKPLDKERLLSWHARLFPEGRGPLGKVRVGDWRRDETGPMQVVSGPLGREKVHFEAPPAEQLNVEMKEFLKWFEGKNEENGILKAGIAHLWFVTIHPFDDGNGRVGRAVLDLALSRCDQRQWRCYSVSSQIREERKGYYDALEQAQSGDLDITNWLTWYLNCLGRALEKASETISSAISRNRFWTQHADKPFNDRQRKLLARMMMGWEGKMTPKKLSAMTGASPKTAQRDLGELVELGILRREDGGRSTGYILLPQLIE